MKRKLSPRQSKVFNLFDRFDKDVEIRRMYLAVFGNAGTSDPSFDTRTMQMKLGPWVQRINAKLEAGRLVPGELKQTYRLIRITKEQ